ncbi:MAG: preprotein translocase subunit SecE [Actinomycetota bacterium]|nr:preprotein translocase subunit SecE [Actinomycetota bacterium]
MNREIRRLQEREERHLRQQQARGAARRPARRERTGVRQFLHEVRVELKRVAWPSREELVTYTAVTLITTTALTLLTFGLDVSFKESVLFLLQRS